MSLSNGTPESLPVFGLTTFGMRRLDPARQSSYGWQGFRRKDQDDAIRSATTVLAPAAATGTAQRALVRTDDAGSVSLSGELTAEGLRIPSVGTGYLVPAGRRL